MSLNTNTTKITSKHLERKAIVYVRQSSPKQVREHIDSQLSQRALVERAQHLGWHPDRIEVLDKDLGISASQAQCRDDFKALAAEVALGHVGIVFGWDVSRLARNNVDWYQLLDLAALFDTLIGDNDGIYDPKVYNDRLLLGLKGTMSEAELYTLRQRLNAGRLSKVQRGEYVQHLPTGLVRLAPTQQVVKDPDAQVRHVIELVFAKFEELGSCPKVMRYCKAHDILLPRRQTSGFDAGELLWKKPSAAAIYEIISNPAYAGVFAYGRRPKGRTRQHPDPQDGLGRTRKPMSDWQCMIQDIYPAYIRWEQYVSNQARLHDNVRCYLELTGGSRGAPRQGAALLQGLATCGCCGCQMKVVYKSSGVRYTCYGLAKQFGEPLCAHLDGASIEAFVVDAFFQAIAPAQLDALDEVLQQRHRERQQLEKYHQQQIQQAEYEVTLARRRYEQVDPDNRLVASELEHQWEEKLQRLQTVQETANRFAQQPPTSSICPQMRQQLSDLSQHLPQLWSSKQLTHEQRKQLLRSLMTRVILRRIAPDQVQVKIVWVSGHFSEGIVNPPIWRHEQVTGYDAILEQIERLWREGHTDRQIAKALNDAGFRSARKLHFTNLTVLKIRQKQQWNSRVQQHKGAEKLDGMWTIQGLAMQLGVPVGWVYTRIRNGVLSEPDLVRRPSGNYLIPDDEPLMARLRQAVQQTRPSPKSHS
jgi:DNA invertase Pin-like site-specific DNA recombinase